MNVSISSRDLITGIFNGEQFDRIPVWFMRQAGRYLPEYMEIRKNTSFEKRSQTPDLAAKITLQPIERFDLDAAIIFSDILIPLYAMNRGLTIVPGKGPILDNPIRDPESIDELYIPSADNDFPYLRKSIELVRNEIPDKALIGFSGAPFTLVSYLIEGKSTKSGVITKGYALKYPDEFHSLMSKLSDIIIDQLKAQIKAGADFVQIFDSWAGHLSPIQFEEWSMPYLNKIVSSITEVPKIFYSRGTKHILPIAKELDASGFSVDTTVDLRYSRELIGPNKLLQGNLDPAYLLSTPELVKDATEKILREASNLGPSNYIFNLGVGINKNSTIENVTTMVKTVKEFRRN